MQGAFLWTSPVHHDESDRRLLESRSRIRRRKIILDESRSEFLRLNARMHKLNGIEYGIRPQTSYETVRWPHISIDTPKPSCMFKSPERATKSPDLQLRSKGQRKLACRPISRQSNAKSVQSIERPTDPLDILQEPYIKHLRQRARKQ